MTGNPELIAAIRREINERGPITFARFMELALYSPQHGYYTSGRARIGKRGDFFTSPAVGPLFGRFLGIQFVEMWESLGKPRPFVLLEVGAHRGWLAEDLMQWAHERRPEFANAIDYWICERNQGKVEGQKRYRKWFPDWREIESHSVNGCIFSNELLDSLPVHRVRRENGQWKEMCVSLAGDRLEFTSQPLSFAAKDLPLALRYLPLPDGYTTEVNFAAFDWLEHMARILKRGYLLTIDYGYQEQEYYAPHRTDGTLLCYYRHTSNNEPLERVGEQDMTAHVNFSWLIDWGSVIGLPMKYFTDQTRFLMRVGRDEIERIVNAKPGQPDKLRQQLQTLLNPAGLGRAFKVLIQQKEESPSAAQVLPKE